MGAYLSYRGSSFELPEGETLVGRDAACRLRLHAAAVSRHHARFVVAGDRVELEDLESRNGTFVNGRRVAGRRALEIGDEVAIGDRHFVFQLEEGEANFEPITAVSDASEFERAGQTVPDVTRPNTPAPDRAERRRHPRHPVEVPVVYESEDLQVEAVSLNLSASGVFVCTPILDDVGTSCRLVVHSNGRRELALPGKVRRVVDSAGAGEPLGLGIEFTELDGGARQWLEEALSLRA